MVGRCRNGRTAWRGRVLRSSPLLQLVSGQARQIRENPPMTPSSPRPPAGGFSVVELALRRPYTFIVMAMLIVLATPVALLRMATDIFPEIDIPVVSIVWNYRGLSAQEMGQRIAAQNERSLTTTVSDIEHIESQSLAGITIIKVFFQPNANIQMAVAQVVAIAQTQVRQLPP